jgi:hypothetical protein
MGLRLLTSIGSANLYARPIAVQGNFDRDFRTCVRSASY